MRRTHRATQKNVKSFRLVPHIHRLVKRVHPPMSRGHRTSDVMVAADGTKMMMTKAAMHKVRHMKDLSHMLALPTDPVVVALCRMQLVRHGPAVVMDPMMKMGMITHSLCQAIHEAVLGGDLANRLAVVQTGMTQTTSVIAFVTMSAMVT